MLNITRSKAALPLQALFLLLNAIGLVVGTVYDSKTPDLYPNNAHHKIGWAVTWIASLQAILALIRVYVRTSTEIEISEPIIKNLEDAHEIESYRYSRDSGHGTESSSSSSRSNSISFMRDKECADPLVPMMDYEGATQRESEQHRLLRNNAVDRYLSRKLSWTITSRILNHADFLINLIDRTILILGFIALATGLVTYGGLFVGFPPVLRR